MDINQARLHNYFDMSALSDLQHKAARNENANEAVAEQLEGLFLEMMLKSMRESEKIFQSELISRDSESLYQDMHDKQLTNFLSQSKSIGLKEVIAKQLQMQKSVSTPESKLE